MNKLGVHYEGHNIIEIGAVEVINRRLTGRNFHVYIKPERLVDPEAFEYAQAGRNIHRWFMLRQPRPWWLWRYFTLWH